MITINLLPLDKRKKALGRQPLAPFIWTIAFLFLSILVFYLYLSSHVQIRESELLDLQSDIKKSKSQVSEYNNLKQEFNDTEKMFSEMKKVNSKAKLILENLQLIKNNTPQNVFLSGLSLAKDKEDNIQITATAPNLRTAALYREKINAEDWVKEVELSSFNFNEDNTISFNLTITTKETL